MDFCNFLFREGLAGADTDVDEAGADANVAGADPSGGGEGGRPTMKIRMKDR